METILDGMVTKVKSTQSVHDKKKLFLSEVEKYNTKYSVEYLQSFVDYWGEIVGKNMRIESNQNMLLSSLLEKWKDKRIEIEQEKKYTDILAQAEDYAEGRLNEYMDVYQSIIQNDLEKNRENIKESPTNRALGSVLLREGQAARLLF